MSVEVQQVDRKAAEPFRLGRGGRYDRIVDALAQAFAAHRHQAEEAMRERCAVRMNAEAMRIGSMFSDGIGMTDIRVACQMKMEWAAAAIRGMEVE